MKLAYSLLFVLLLPAVRGEDIEIACEPPPGSVGAKAFENEFCQGRDPTPEEAVAARRPAYYAYAKQEPKRKADPPSGIVIHLPPAPKPPDPIPPPQPKPGAPVSLLPGKLLLITSGDTKDDKGSIVPAVELFLKWIARDGSEVSITALKGPVMIYGDFIDPQPDDENGRKIGDPYVYVVRAKVGGQGTLVVVPSGVKAGGGIVSQGIDVGGTPPNPAITISISPTSATVQTGGRQQFAATVSQGGVTWKSQGVGSVDQNGLFTATTVGSATIVCTAALDPSKTATAVVTVTSEPPPNPAPIPVAGFRVLILYSVKDEESYPASQQAILYDASIRSYLASHCVKGAGNTPERRIWDANVDASAESKLWQDALKRDRKTLPWIIISDGKTGTEQPLPKTIDETLTLLRKYGGN